MITPTAFVYTSDWFTFEYFWGCAFTLLVISLRTLPRDSNWLMNFISEAMSCISKWASSRMKSARIISVDFSPLKKHLLFYRLYFRSKIIIRLHTVQKMAAAASLVFSLFMDFGAYIIFYTSYERCLILLVLWNRVLMHEMPSMKESHLAASYSEMSNSKGNDTLNLRAARIMPSICNTALGSIYGWHKSARGCRWTSCSLWLMKRDAMATSGSWLHISGRSGLMRI